MFASTGLLAVPDVILVVVALATAGTLERATRTGALGWWCLLGVLLALGFGIHYRFVLIPGCVALYLVATANGRKQLSTPGPWLAAAITLPGLLPIVRYNVHNDFASLKVQLRRASRMGVSYGRIAVSRRAGWRDHPADLRDARRSFRHGAPPMAARRRSRCARSNLRRCAGAFFRRPRAVDRRALHLGALGAVQLRTALRIRRPRACVVEMAVVGGRFGRRAAGAHVRVSDCSRELHPDSGRTSRTRSPRSSQGGGKPPSTRKVF